MIVEPEGESTDSGQVPTFETVSPAEPGPAPTTGATNAVAPAGERPMVEPGLPIGAYTDDQLDALVNWLLASGVDRDRVALSERLRSELGLTRRGVRIDGMVAAAVHRALA